jgi:hypothetical protein
MGCFVLRGVLLEELKAFPEVYENQNWFGKAIKWKFRFSIRWIFLPSVLIMR